VVEDGRSGFLVEGHDPGDHADRLLQILRDPRLQSAFGEQAAHQALRFTWDATTDQMVTVYDEVLASSGATGAGWPLGSPPG
jgi:D-inositol-3-phosphate glycosyltransferase